MKCLFCNRLKTEQTPKHIYNGICRKCKASGLALEGIVSRGSYQNEAIRRALHWFKFRGVSGLAEPLAGIMVKVLTAIAPLDRLREEAALVPIPLHFRRERWRGFNQSDVLARELTKLTGIPTWSLIGRKKQTYTQSKLPARLRPQNMTDAFYWQGIEMEDKKWWLLVDDVCTSGSTLEAAARVLKEHSEAAVWGVTVARG